MERISKAIAIGFILFAVVFAAFAGSRVDQMTIALLGGVFIGLLITVPSALLAMALILRRRDERADLSQPLTPPSPLHWAPPPASGSAPPTAQVGGRPWFPSAPPELSLPSPRRRFYVIGEAGEVRELTDPLVEERSSIEDEERNAHL